LNLKSAICSNYKLPGLIPMIRDLLQESYDAMRHNRRRTALTMLGMAWGIATVVMLLAYGDGFGRACANIFANFGTKLMIVVPGRSSMQSGGEKAGAQTRITLDDVDLLATNIPQITHITPDCFKSRPCNTTLALTP
jgi:putative ABC transport system permease protein